MKNQFQMTTDMAENMKAPLWPAIMIIMNMPEGTFKYILSTIWMICMVAISYLQTGHKADPEFADLPEKVDNIQQLLDKGRQP